MFKYILVPATGSDTDDPVFRAAAALARVDGAHLVFLHVGLDVEKLIVPIASAEFGGGTGFGEFVTSMEQDATARRDRARDAVRAFCADQNIAMSATPAEGRPTAEWRAETGEGPHWLAVHGRAADLIVLGHVRDTASPAMDMMNAALMETGRPLLIVPTREFAQIGRTVAIAWKDTPEAAGAVAAATPLLARASRVAILSVTENAETDAAACERLRAALTWHNPATTTQHLAPVGGEPADTLLKAAAELGADLLVMGGYGHSRLREVVFGGFTRRILQVADLPVLMAH